MLVGVQAVLLVAIVVLPRRGPEPAAVVVAAVLAAIGVGLGLAAVRTLGSALTANPVPIDGAGLRTSGAYRRIRHPIYTAVILLAAGFAVAVGSWWTVAAVLVLAGFFWAKSRWEDRLLRERYGPQWDAWAQHTGALLPRPRP